MKVRRPLLAIFAVTVLASAVSLWRPSGPPSALIVDATARNDVARAPAMQAMDGRSPTARLPERLHELEFEVGRRELFNPIEPKPASTPAPVSVQPPPPAQAAELVPVPALGYRFWGRMQAPDGAHLTLLARGDKVVAVTVGQELEDGFKVLAVEPQSVRFSHVRLDSPLELPIPSPTGP